MVSIIKVKQLILMVAYIGVITQRIPIHQELSVVIHQKILTSSFISIILSYAMIAGIDVGSCTEGGPNHLYIQGGKVINNKCTASNGIGGINVNTSSGSTYTHSSGTVSGNTPNNTGSW